MRSSIDGQEQAEESVSFLSELGFGPGQVISKDMLDSPSVGELTLQLEITNKAMNITVQSVTDIKLSALPRSTELYIKLYLQQGIKETSKHTKQRTKPVRIAEEMDFNETLHFSMSPDMDVVKVMLWEEKRGRNPIYGVATIKLTDLFRSHDDDTASVLSDRQQKQTIIGTYTLQGSKPDGRLGVMNSQLATSTASITSSTSLSFRAGRLKSLRKK